VIKEIIHPAKTGDKILRGSSALVQTQVEVKINGLFN
jgi:hypothetical protein